MNFIEALKSGKRIRHKRWYPGWQIERPVENGRSFVLYDEKNTVIDPHWFVAILDMLEETGWEVVKTPKKIETTWEIAHSYPVPMDAKVTIEWEE